MSTTDPVLPPDEKKDTPAATVPAPAASSSAKAKPAGIDRFSIGLATIIQVFVALAILLMINVIGYRHFTRWDFSRNQKYSLSNLTKNLMDKLAAGEDRVQAIVFLPERHPLFEDVSRLLREYEIASKKKLLVERVDIFRNLQRARELSEKYKFGEQDAMVILDYKGRSKFVNAMDMAELDNSGQMMGQPPTVRAFKGEEALTSALLELTEEKQNKVYFLTGHGEPEYSGPQLTALKAYMERQNLKGGDKLNLNNASEVPADATAVVIFAPKTDLSEREVKLLSDYWTEKKGRLLVLLNPLNRTQRLNDWLASQGVTPKGNRVLKTGNVLQQGENGQPVLRSGLFTSPVAVISTAGREVSKDLVNIDLQLLGPTQSLSLDAAKAQASGERFIQLLESAEGFWGETDLASIDARQVYFDSQKDDNGPLTLAVAIERGGMADQRVKVDTGRMVIVGNAGFLLNDGLQLSEGGIDFALNAINWIVNREQVAGIAPKPKTPARLNVPESSMEHLALTLIVIIPAMVAFLGFGVSWVRRSF